LFEWHKRFKVSGKGIKDSERTGCLMTLWTVEKVEGVWKLVYVDSYCIAFKLVLRSVLHYGTLSYLGIIIYYNLILKMLVYYKNCFNVLYEKIKYL
jgi:hypothetical protein